MVKDIPDSTMCRQSRCDGPKYEVQNGLNYWKVFILGPRKLPYRLKFNPRVHPSIEWLVLPAKWGGATRKRQLFSQLSSPSYFSFSSPPLAMLFKPSGALTGNICPRSNRESGAARMPVYPMTTGQMTSPVKTVPSTRTWMWRNIVTSNASKRKTNDARLISTWTRPARPAQAKPRTTGPANQKQPPAVVRNWTTLAQAKPRTTGFAN